MRHSKCFSQRGGVWIMMILWIVMGIISMPACSKKTGEKTTTTDTASVSETTRTGTVAAPQDKRQELLGKLKQLQGALIMMQGITLKKHPELLEEQTALKNLIEGKVNELLGEKNVDTKQLVEMQKKLKDQSLPEAERATLTKEYQEKTTLLSQARMNAMTDEKVNEAYKKYETHLKEMLKADHADAAEKMDTFDKLNAELQEIQNSTMPGAPPANK